VGVGITILVRNSQSNEHFIRYHRVPEFWRSLEKLEYLVETNDLDGVEWQKLIPNKKKAWFTEGLEEDFETFAPLGSKDAKASFSADIKTVFRHYSLGVSTNRDAIAYDFESENLKKEVMQFMSVFNTESLRWKAAGTPKDIDAFVSYDEMKWSRNLKRDLKTGQTLKFEEKNVRSALYRPYCKTFLYFADSVVDERGTWQKILPTVEVFNRVICLSGISSNKSFHCLMTDCIPDLHLTGDSQCFPLYTYSLDGEHRSENVTPWAIEQFGGELTREQIFYATYALLHHPTYRSRYAENLKRELPRIPTTLFDARELARIGKTLGDLHVDFETAPELESVKIVEAKREKGVKVSFRVEAMKWNKEKTELTVNSQFKLSGFTPEMFQYKLGNRSALDWLVESFRVKKDARSGLISDPNRDDEPQYILRLVRRVAHISLETQRLIGQLPAWPEEGSE
jgi:predicted helicase